VQTINHFINHYKNGMFTEYDHRKNDFVLVEEPDSSLEYSYADYLKWKFEERVELIKGRIMKMTAPNRKHQDISRELMYHFTSFLKNKPCKAYNAPFDVRLPRKDKATNEEILTVVQPDVCIICDASKLDDKGCVGAPDLVIEILSPGNSKKEIKLKYDVYEEAGVKEYWIINPVEENVAVLKLNASGKFEGARLYATDDIIYANAVEGLAIHLSDIFSNE
jgi:Uma2 family endonuclease